MSFHPLLFLIASILLLPGRYFLAVGWQVSPCLKSIPFATRISISYHHASLALRLRAVKNDYTAHSGEKPSSHPGSIENSSAGGWMERVGQIIDYKQANGHTRVPKRYKENPALGNWVNKQRQQYRNYLVGTKPVRSQNTGSKF